MRKTGPSPFDPVRRPDRVPWAIAVAVVVVLGASTCRRDEPQPVREGKVSSHAWFIEVARQSGIRHAHQKPVLDHKLDGIMPWVSSVGAAAAAGDYNRDGWIDLYVTNSRKGLPNYLYRNNGDGTFTDVAASAGLAYVNSDFGVSMDCIWSDYDNDGWIDLYLVRWGNDALFRNNGDGTFSDVTERTFRRHDGTPGTDWANGNAAVFLDYDRDGLLDVYVGNYFDEVDLWHLESTSIMHDSFESARNAGRNYLYHQEADGKFRNVATKLGVEDRGWTLAVGSADVNNDGWPDLYCADDFGPDQLFLNRGDGTFRDATQTALGGDTKKGMNVDFGDYDNDGWLDVYVTNITTAEYLQEGNMLWHNDGVDESGRLRMTDIAVDAGVYDGGWGWGAKFFDYDLDGDLDIISVNGFISAGEGNYWYDLATWTVTGDDVTDATRWPPIGNRSFSGYEKTRLWRNDGWSAFTERARELGMDSDRDGRGIVCFDYDNDGDLDVFVANHDQAPQLFRNDGADGGRWLLVHLLGDPALPTNKDAVGARVTIVTKDGQQIRERDGGNGFSGQSDPRLHFGLGGADRVDLLEVRWPDGGLQYLEGVATNTIVTMRQDQAAYVAKSMIDKRTPALAVSHETRDVPPIVREPQSVAPLLDDLEKRIGAGASGYSVTSKYRALCVAHDQHDRAIRFFEERVRANPMDAHSRIELASAYVDKIPLCGGMAAVVCKGSLAKKSLNQLDTVLEHDSKHWPALYCRGVNHLHWPRSLRHSDDAAADLERCIEIADSRFESPPAYLLRVYVAWGDALAKDKRFDEARIAWRKGMEVFGDAPDLRERLAVLSDQDLLRYVESKRSLEQPVDTDLSFLDE